MQSSDFIIAINTDPDAAIFQIANLGVVGNALEVVPALTEAFRKALCS
jgi:electron transfer flavoprotein alpha subunit